VLSVRSQLRLIGAEPERPRAADPQALVVRAPGDDPSGR
jgi:hypothetical protein